MIEFWKMSGSGNDFILIDNRQGRVPEDEMGSFTRKVCRRRESVGADGTIFVSESQNYDFRWHYLNADGGEAEMCGNGARCVARFAFMKGIAGQKMTFQTLAGPVSAEVAGRMVKVLMPSPSGLETDIDIQHKPGWKSVDFVNTGVPHVVVQVDNLEAHPVVEQGRAVRIDPSFSPAGTNADFINIVSSDLIEMRTYERGVEDETLACGTGAIASAVVASARDMVHSPVRVKTRGGEELKIYFKKKGMLFEEVWLEGSTSLIYEGRLNEEAL
ncbi:MAG: diaminopimelate epimerase [Deltaproteobacteria bacterium]|nr:MAG: diaminopimelate epimerase [Deltaproteobacteria bacterium]